MRSAAGGTERRATAGGTIVIRGGQVYHPGEPAPQTADIAVADGTIAAVGSPSEVADVTGAVAGNGGRRRIDDVDAAGCLVTVGFTDAHVHPGAAALEALHCNLIPADGEQAYLALIADYRSRLPVGSWLTGGGWVEENFSGGAPAPGLLDSVTVGHPAYLLNRDHHSAWVNAAALRLAGVTEHTADPADGLIGRDRAGRLTGVLHEGAMDLVAAVLPPTDSSLLRRAMLNAQRELHALGIVGWQDAIVGRSALLPDFFDTYCELDAAGLLTARVVGAQWWDRRGGTDQLAGMLDRRSVAAAGSRFSAGSVKLMLDGVCESHTAALLSPYLRPGGESRGGPEPGTGRSDTGIDLIEPEALHDAARAAHDAGFQLHFHALGDRAVRRALDAVEAALTRPGAGAAHRHHIAHLQIVDPADVPRFGALGVTANAQALWACSDRAMTELTVPFLGPERSARQYPFASIARAGGRVAFGSDWPVSSNDPMAILATAVTRTPVDDPGAEPFLPAERLTLAQALTAATAGSAWLNGAPATLTVGAPADLVVLDRDPFQATPDELADISALATMVAGEWVYRRR